MRLSLLQLNIYKGKYLKEIISYIKENDFDILQFQEVSGGNVTFGQTDCFDKLINATSYNGHLVKSLTHFEDTNSYFGNATFYKKKFVAVKNEVIWLKPYKQIVDYNSATNKELKNVSRSALDVVLKVNNRNIHFINTHLAWGESAEDRDYKLNQAQILVDYIKKLKEPFVLTGDFNVAPETKLIKRFDELGANLLTKYNVPNTLNPNTHRAKHLFPKGLAVDYIFASPTLAIRDFQLIDKPNLSDHYGLAVELEI